MSLEALQSGAQRGAAASLARLGLSFLSGGYALARQGHRLCYRLGLCRRERLPVPVVSVGNLTVGGVGKTPFVEWLAADLLGQGLRPVVLARGYGRRPGEALNDEGQWLVQRLPGLPVVQNSQRAAEARRFLEQDRCDVFLLDDGFQHEPLARDLDLVLLDGTRPFGHGHLLPRGLLREPLSALRRARQGADGHRQGRRARHRQEHRRCCAAAAITLRSLITGVMVPCGEDSRNSSERAQSRHSLACPASLRRRLDEMVHVAKEMQRHGVRHPVDDRRSDHVSAKHTAVKIAPHYAGGDDGGGVVTHVKDASLSVPAWSRSSSTRIVRADYVESVNGQDAGRTGS